MWKIQFRVECEKIVLNKNIWICIGKLGQFQMISWVSSLCQIISGGCLCRDKYFKAITIFVSVLFNLYRDALVVYRENACANAGDLGFEFHREQICVSILLYWVECKELFWKTNIKLLEWNSKTTIMCGRWLEIRRAESKANCSLQQILVESKSCRIAPQI